MKQDFVKTWKSSKQPRKQRKYTSNIPQHLRKRLLSTRLSKELIKKYGKKTIPIRKEDKVTILRGQFKKVKGSVTKVDYKNIKVQVDSAQHAKKDGSKAFYPIHPSNLMITDLNLDDKERKKILERVKNDIPKENKPQSCPQSPLALIDG